MNLSFLQAIEEITASTNSTVKPMLSTKRLDTLEKNHVWIFESPIESNKMGELVPILSYIEHNVSCYSYRAPSLSSDVYRWYFKPRIWNLKKEILNSPYSETYQKIKKVWKKFDIMDEILRRMLRVEYALRVYEIIYMEPKQMSHFIRHYEATPNTTDLRTYFHMAKTEEYRLEFPYQIEIIPYIHKNLIECLELMGISYYDFKDYNWDTIVYKRHPSELMFLMIEQIYQKYIEGLEELKVSKKLSPDMEFIKHALLMMVQNDHKNSVHDATELYWEWTIGLQNLNTLHPILLLDYMWSSVNEINSLAHRSTEDYPFVTNNCVSIYEWMLYSMRKEYSSAVDLLSNFKKLLQYWKTSGNEITWDWSLCFHNPDFDNHGNLSREFFRYAPKEDKELSLLLNYEPNFNFHIFDDLEKVLWKISYKGPVEDW